MHAQNGIYVNVWHQTYEGDIQRVCGIVKLLVILPLNGAPGGNPPWNSNEGS